MKKTNFGLLLGFSTYILWGFLSLFWKLLSGVNAYNTFSYRIIFTLLTMLIYMLISKNKSRYQKEVQSLLADGKSFLLMFLASLLISINWLTYIYAVSHGQATQASLGYYMMPLVSILLSVLILREKLGGAMLLAIFLAGIGVTILVVNTGHLPLISMTLAFSFGIYGLIKKNIRLSSDVAMLVEGVVIAPFALLYLLFFSHDSFFSYSALEMGLLVISGIITAIPLLLFAEAVKRAPLNLIGFIQYINPTIQLLIALFIFGETIGRGELFGFSFIWLAILVFVFGQVLPLMVRKNDKKTRKIINLSRKK